MGPTDAEDERLSHRRRALAPVHNHPTSMDEDEMGLQTQPNLVKDSHEMEQILNELGNTDIAQADLLQVIKTFEGGDPLSTGDTDGMFPLPGFDLADTIDSEGDMAEDKIKQAQTRLERRCAFLQRRVRILQARAIGKRVSDEVALTYERCVRSTRKDGAGRTPGLKAFLKRVETTASLQASAASRTVNRPKYYHAGTSKVDATKSASIGIPSGTLAGLEDTAGALRSHLSVVKKELDSDATLSSSGAESNDEDVVYNNPHQQHLPIDKRALWSWQRARASIASRWCWLQAQVQELDYKVRQHTDLQKQVRAAKGPIQFEGEPVAYEGPLPGSTRSDDDPALETCARVRPLRRETFKKRKLLQMHNLHTAAPKAAKPSDIRCLCACPAESCGVCTGRVVSTQPAPPFTTLSAPARIAAVDPAYHAVLSDIRDVPPSVHLSALSCRTWFRSRSMRAPPQPPKPQPPKPLPIKPLREPSSKYLRSKRGRPPSRKVPRERDRERERDKDKEEEISTPVATDRTRSRPSTESRHSRVNSSYDIDNIVIPQSVAASTRPEILHYKEIVTPKWRLVDSQSKVLNNGNYMHDTSDSEEDISDAAMWARHARSEAGEKARYTRIRKPRRSTTQTAPTNDNMEEDISDAAMAARHARCEAGERAVSSRVARGRRSQPGSVSAASAPTEDVPAPAPAPIPTAGCSTSTAPGEIIKPYSPRQFPIPDDAYQVMLSMMPDGHRPSSPDLEPGDQPDEEEGTLSPVSPPAYDCDDPDDIEWNPSRDKERKERRKSHVYR